MACVILLEDDADLRELFAHALSQAGHEVHAAPNSRGIMALVRDNAAAVLVTDLIMPGHEGMEGIFLARQQQGLRILAMSSNRDFLRLAEGLVDCCMLKPFTAEDLLEKVETLLKRT